MSPWFRLTQPSTGQRSGRVPVEGNSEGCGGISSTGHLPITQTFLQAPKEERVGRPPVSCHKR